MINDEQGTRYSSNRMQDRSTQGFWKNCIDQVLGSSTEYTALQRWMSISIYTIANWENTA